ncbi:polysaccharide deacetylase family protein [Nonomuraea sediminis]|uniref:polysaccharide deacetylase family protein n=1 Tax=Nonomuraea sediminis TaxID=2835864 RepID=UPI001BDD9A11|nr:polysaccharide deacetylase family protein [Nonomuraea sediminis]
MLIHGVLALSLSLSGLTGATAGVDCAKVKCLALTFDDGPSAYTAKLLDTLKREKVKATFFLMGQHVEQYPKLARRQLAEGHAIGNHTWDHPHLPAMTDQQILDEIRTTQDAIAKATGQQPKLFRPPYGDTDQRVLDLVGQEGLPQILWTGTTLDWKLRDPKKITAAVLRLARRDGVILMHDVVPQTVKAMPGIIKDLKKRGFHLVTVPALLRGKPVPPGTTYPPAP